jgi:Tol biopolymer transport system component
MTDIPGSEWLRPLILATTVALLAGCARTGEPATEVPSDASSAPSGPATTSPASMQIGPLTFMRKDLDESWQTWVACGDLAEATQVTDVAARDSGYPVWSTDGSRIAFDSNRDDPNPDDDTVINDVFTMQPDGGRLIRLTDGVSNSSDPAYSPDASLIAFASDGGRYPAKQGIYLMNAVDGSQVRRVTSLPPAASLDYAPRFSPDGKRLVFTRDVDEASLAGALYVVNLDGSGLRKITSDDLYPGDADWSPDGTRIVFEAADPQSPFGGVWIVGSDGSGLRNVTAPASGVGALDGFSDPVWSPDGSLILTLHGVHSDDGVFIQGGLATIRPDGTELQYIGDGRGAEHQADWSTSEC